MAAERQVPGGPFVNEVGTAQRMVPGGVFVNETVAGGAPTFNPAWARNSNTVIVAATGADQK